VENQELALVFEDGDVIGMVTVTDSLASITGEIQDPLDIS
jgi:CBS domain containing-hemolysin-like protein